MDALDALSRSGGRLRAIVEPLDDASIAAPAYPSQWSTAQVLSHLGSAAEIMRRRFEDALTGREMPDEFVPAVWDEWNAKEPRAQVRDALVADATLLERLDALPSPERERFVMSMGPITVDFMGFVGLRVNEHVLHTWDVEVAVDPSATIPEDLAAVVVDNLGLIAQYTGKYDGEPITVAIRTTRPETAHTLRLGDQVTLAMGATGDSDVDLTLPGDALIRVVYGRLDPEHTPAGLRDDPTVDRLRQTFPGP
jgi:uncharacterized protein (TIGR03083 family)